MGVSVVTLAKKIKATVEGHGALVERDGTGHIPESFNFNFGGELNEASANMRRYIDNIYQHLRGTASFPIPAREDESRDAQVQRNHIFAIRALYTLCNSPRGILRTTFQNRTYAVDDLDECIPGGYNALQALEDTACIFQFKRHTTDDNNPWVFSWMLAVEGMSISRGSKQPIHKLVSALLKLVTSDIAVAAPNVQSAVAELAKLKSTTTPYYWFLSNQETTMYYHAFETYRSLRSCMSKPHSFYNHTGRRQHPMDCYDDSPDWSMMMLTTKSPTEIIEMCNLVIANPGDAESLFEFPFLTRCLVLPTDKETSNRTFETPYVMGKFYGQDKLVNFFFNDSSGDGIYHKNTNSLLSGAAKIDGGRIQAIPSTSDEGVYLLPYFDKENKARFVKEGDQTWWVSVGVDLNIDEPIAKCMYEYGSGKFESFKSLAYGGRYTISSYVLNTIETVFGEDLADFSDHYLSHEFDGAMIKIPKKMFIEVNGQNYLRGQLTALYDGSWVVTAEMLNDQERYQIVGSMGIFDLQSAKHKDVYDRLVLATNSVTPVPTVEESTTEETSNA